MMVKMERILLLSPAACRWITFLLLWLSLQRVQATRKASCNGWTLTAPKEGDFRCNPMGVTVSMPGTRCMLECEAGYRAKQEVLVCTENGGWVPTNSPECEADTTMTLVIVFSIVGSIILVLGLSFVYAKTTKRCRGSRRKEEDDDPEAALRRKEVKDTSTYYGHVKRLKRKRRIQAERQRQKAAARLAQGQKTVTKQPKGQSKKELKSREKSKPQSRHERDRVKEIKNFRTEKSKTPPRKTEPKNKRAKKPTIGQNFNRSMQEFFCFLCNACSGDKKAPKKVTGRKPGQDDVKVISISNTTPRPVPKRKVPPPPSSSSSSSDTDSTSSGSSSDSSSSEDDGSPPKKIEKMSNEKPNKIVGKKKPDDTETPVSRAKKPPQKPPPPKAKKTPPPRPPAPLKLVSNAATSFVNSSSESPESDKRTDGRRPGPAGISSGYSSDGERHRRKRGFNDSAMAASKSQSSKNHRPTHHHERDVGYSNSKRMQILSTGAEKEESTTGNPYHNYPAALSYRQYQDFENDYRRTTGDYRPQYSIVQIIPLNSAKNSKKEEEKQKKNEEDKEEVEPRMEKAKSVQGGMKYICISEEEEDSDSDDEYCEKRSHKMRRHQRQRYEGPSERDRRRHSPDYNDKPRPAKREKKSEKPKRTESSAKRDRKREIEDERIIDDGHNTNPRQSGRPEKLHNKKKHHEKRENKSKVKHHKKSNNKKPENSRGNDAEN